MNIHIELSQCDVDGFLRHLPLDTFLRQTLANSNLTFESSNVFDCSEGDARALLCIASHYYPEGVQKIEHCLRLSGVTNF